MAYLLAYKAVTNRLSGLTIPSSRVPLWDPGVEGDIPDTSGWGIIDVTDAPYSATGNGVTDDGAAIASAISACSSTYPNGGKVYFPDGTYYFAERTLSIPSNCLLIGGASWGAKLYPFTDTTYPPFKTQGSLGGEITFSTGASSGDTSFTLSSSPGWSPGQWVLIKLENDPAWVDWPVAANADHIVEVCKVSAVDGAVITVDRPLRHDYPLASIPKAYALTPASQVGFENLVFEFAPGSGATYTLYEGFMGLSQAVNSWIYNCKFVNGLRHSIVIDRSSRCTVRHNYIPGPPLCISDAWSSPHSNYQINLVEGATDCLIEDNIIVVTHSWVTIQRGAAGNVVAYNYCHDMTGISPAVNQHGIFVHGEYPVANLIEGNVIGALGAIEFDLYWGRQGPYNTLFRNRLEGSGTTKATSRPIAMENSGGAPVKYISDYTNILLNTCYVMTGTPFGNPLPDSPDVDQYSENMWIERNIYSGWLRLDTPEATTTNTNNVNGSTAPAAWDGITFGRSLYLSGKPTWWPGGKAWPCIGADVDTIGSSISIPAQDWFGTL